MLPLLFTYCMVNGNNYVFPDFDRLKFPMALNFQDMQKFIENAKLIARSDSRVVCGVGGVRSSGI